MVQTRYVKALQAIALINAETALANYEQLRYEEWRSDHEREIKRLSAIVDAMLAASFEDGM